MQTDTVNVYAMITRICSIAETRSKRYIYSRNVGCALMPRKGGALNRASALIIMNTVYTVN